MGEDLRTRVCTGCGFPALAGTRRCPFCREMFQRPAAPRRGLGPDPLAWLAAAWAVAVAPLSLLVLTTLGAPFTVPVILAALVPACGVWLLRRRATMRIRRYMSRASHTGRRTRSEPSNPSPDAQRR